jgi:hypothetical protein
MKRFRQQQLTTQISDIIETLVVKGTGVFPGVKPDTDEIVARANALTNYQLALREPVDFFDARVPVAVLDQIAHEQTRRAQVVAATSGAGTGLLGIPGMAIDLPILVANTVGLVRRHAITYGFTTIEESTEDQRPLLIALGISVGADMVIDRLGVFGERVGLELSVKLVEKYLVGRISKQFAARLVTSWLPRLVPIIGTATIAALDTAFLTLAGRESRRYFRQRHWETRNAIAMQKIDRAGWKAVAERSALTLPPGPS